MTGDKESQEGLTPEEMARLEKNIPAFKRKEKIEARGNLTRGARGSGITPAGGMASKLNPLNPKDKEWGEPTHPVTPEEIGKPGHN